MSYYPLLKAPGCRGEVVIHNFPPNNWEVKKPSLQYVSITWTDGKKWNSAVLDTIRANESKVYMEDDLPTMCDALPLISLVSKPLPATSLSLPETQEKTFLPSWRASLTLKSKLASTNYQGELDPFPKGASLLSFSPFLQYGCDVRNYLLLINIEKDPRYRTAWLNVYDSSHLSNPVHSEVIQNNSISIIDLDKFVSNPTALYISTCAEITGVPLYMATDKQGTQLSLEHTHPPMSYGLFGLRQNIQKTLKKNFMSKIKSNS